MSVTSESQEINRKALPPDIGVMDSVVSGMTGPRGSGKTLVMTYLAMQDMANGIPVLANYKIQGPFKKRGSIVNVESQPLDLPQLFEMSSSLRQCVAAIDEINLWFESTRAMSNGNRIIGIVLQQIRKRQMSVYWTSQNFDWVYNRIRWQTDTITECMDAAKTPQGREIGLKKGERILLRTRDESGYLTGLPYRLTGLVFPGVLDARPMWGCYNTEEIIDPWEAMAKVEIKRPKLVLDLTGQGDLDSEFYEKQADIISKQRDALDRIRQRIPTSVIGDATNG